MLREIKAGIAGATVAASEQNLFKSDKGSGIFPLNKPEVAQAVFAHTFIHVLAVLLLPTIGVRPRTVPTTPGHRASAMAVSTASMRTTLTMFVQFGVLNKLSKARVKSSGLFFNKVSSFLKRCSAPVIFVE